MKRRPPRSTRTDTLFPYTTLFRSRSKGRERCRPAEPREALPPPCQASAGLFLEARVQQAEMWQSDLGRVAAPAQPSLLELALGDHALVVVEQSRSEERRVGKEGVSPCRSRGSPIH